MFALTVKPGHLSLAELRRAYHEPVQIKLEDQAYAAIDRSVACVNRIVEENRTVYGINTGFGLLASTRIAREDLEKLQRSIVLSHAAGVGEAVDDATVRLIMLLKINSLARGFSGVRRIVKPKICLPLPASPAASPSKPHLVRAHRLMPAFMRCAASKARLMRRRFIAICWAKKVKSACRTPIATRCKTLTACAASRK